MTEPNWQRSAACVGLPADLFFPVAESGPALRQIAAAKAVCSACPVVAPCLDYALSIGDYDGIWGGLSPAERRALAGRRGSALNES